MHKSSITGLKAGLILSTILLLIYSPKLIIFSKDIDAYLKFLLSASLAIYFANQISKKQFISGYQTLIVGMLSFIFTVSIVLLLASYFKTFAEPNFLAQSMAEAQNKWKIEAYTQDAIDSQLEHFLYKSNHHWAWSNFFLVIIYTSIFSVLGVVSGVIRRST